MAGLLRQPILHHLLHLPVEGVQDWRVVHSNQVVQQVILIHHVAGAYFGDFTVGQQIQQVLYLGLGDQGAFVGLI